MQSTQNLMLDLESRLHSEFCSFFDLEGMVFESGECAWSSEVDGDGVTASGVHGEREDDAVAWVVGVREVFSASAQTEGFFVAL
jgi:hypothetical protein